MMTLVTPSAKSHERVTGRWTQDLRAECKRDWAVYYAKLVFGTPIPWIFSAFLCTIFIGRAAVEISAWLTAALTLCYIIADQLSSKREFVPFRIGSDFVLAGFVIASISGVMNSGDPANLISGVGSLRWVVLFYLFSYCWQLFPGLNRMYHILFTFAGLTSIYAIWQHFAGLDLLRSVPLEYAPLKEHAYHIATGFYRHSVILGTILAVLLPFPASAFMLAGKHQKRGTQLLSLLFLILLSLGLLWTYRPGLWFAGGIGLIINMILQPRRHFLFITLTVALLSAVAFVAYDVPERSWEQIAKAEMVRSGEQREQINRQVEIWTENTWIGVGMKSESARETEALEGNVYFQLLAQTGALGLALYLVFSLSFLLGAYRIWMEIPATHYWHRVLVSGGLAGIAAFHVAGLYWSTLSDSHAMNLFAFVLSSLSYLRTHYDRGLVPDDKSL